MRVLIVEDEQKTARYLANGLAENGFVVDVADQGDDGLHLACNVTYDVVILDVMLPGKDGWEILSELRAEDRQSRVIFLTARDAVQDRVKGLRLGADDYLVKPFAFSELLARIHTLLRRSAVRTPETFTVSDLQVNVARRTATRDGRNLELTAKEFALLALLARRSGEVLTRRMIEEQVWDINFDSDANVVDVAIRRLRRKVDEPYPGKLIHTVRGVGYVLEERPD